MRLHFVQIFGLDNPLFSKTYFKTNSKNHVYAARLNMHKVHKKSKFLESNQLFQFVQIESLAVTFHSLRKQKFTYEMTHVYK